MKSSLTVPSKLSEITLKQYRKYIKISENNTDPYFLQCKMIEIFCNLDSKSVRLLKLSSAEKVVNTINNMFEDKPRLIRTFKLDGIEYGLIPQLDDMSLGEYIDLDKNIGDWDNMIIAMNVLYRPISKRIGEKYLINDYNIETKERLIDIPIDIVLGVVFFLHNLGIELSKVMMDYLQEHQKDSLMHKQIFQENGVGIKAFSQDSLKTILEDLNISLN